MPCVWDTETGRIVTNDYPRDDARCSSRSSRRSTRPDAPELYPADLRAEIDEVNAEVFHDVNNGVYKAGFATTQEVYEEAFDALFARSTAWRRGWRAARYLVGDRLTEADVRLYPTLARFDAVYHGHFKCNLRRLVDYPNLWAYARRPLRTRRSARRPTSTTSSGTTTRPTGT